MTDLNLTIFGEHFRDDLTDEEARRLFALSVTLVEIETFTFCNRTCFFCPNKDLKWRQDRQAPQMDEQLYTSILAQLADVNYKERITFSRYNEPLALRDLILTRIRQAREALPETTLLTHTNGDYVTREYLDELRDAGLNELHIQTYLGNDERWNDGKIKARQAQQLRKLGLHGIPTALYLEDVRYCLLTDYPGMKVSLDARNFDELGADRGGLVQLGNSPYHRTSPCFVVFTSTYIDWNGNVLPCCNLRSDVEEHKKYVVGDLNKASLYRAWANVAGWRKSLLTYGEKAPPCSTCSYDDRAYDPEIGAWGNEIKERMKL